MQDPEERREKERQYLRAHEDFANYQCVSSPPQNHDLSMYTFCRRSRPNICATQS
jgi:hypothetical protein